MSTGLAWMKRSSTLTAVLLCLAWNSSFVTPLHAEPADCDEVEKIVKAFKLSGGKAKRIVGGHKTTIAAHPWQVALLAAEVPTNNRAQFCGGSIVGARWIVTAAHCVYHCTKDKVEILTGTASLTSGGTRNAVTNVIVHENYRPDEKDFDIALLSVTADLAPRIIGGFQNGQEPVSDVTTVSVTGWGALAFAKLGGADDLREVSVKYVERGLCNQRASYNQKVTENMFCAGEKGKDSCQGDSGGPATIAIQKGARLIGVVSGGEGCGFPNKPGVYTRLSRFDQWVAEKTKGEVRW
jgi:secreted trypsin-like serine protease